MVLLLGIIIGAVFGIVAAKKGLYCAWGLLINVCISVYLAVFLSPTILVTIGSLAESPYAVAACLAIIAAAIFAILQAITVIFFTGPYNLSFPKVLDSLGAGVLGFLAGFVICGFISLVLLAMPVSRDSFFGGQLAQAAETSVVKACDSVGFLSAQADQYPTKEVVQWLYYIDDEQPDTKPYETDETDSFETEDIGTDI